MEELLNDGLSRHQLNETRTYGRRSREGFSLKDVFVPPHLYGQLALTKAGLDILFKHQALIDMLKVLVNLSPNPMPSNGTPLDTHDFYVSISMTKKEWIYVLISEIRLLINFSFQFWISLLCGNDFQIIQR